MKKKLHKCKMCPNRFVMYNSLRPFCSPECGAKYALKQLEKKKEEDFKVMKVEVGKPKNKKALQDEINKLARMIDAAFGHSFCIDCREPFRSNKVDGAHFHDVGGNPTLRYNLHNIHSALSYCNKFDRKHHSGYEEGLGTTYGAEYQHYVVNTLPLKYKEIHLSAVEIKEKLKVVRALIRNFHTYKFESAYNAREVFNNIIGIYK